MTRSIFITSTSAIPRIDLGRIDTVLEVRTETMFKLWERFIEDIDRIAKSIHEALMLSDPDCLSDRLCTLSIFNEVLVSYIKRLVLTSLVPPKINQDVGVVESIHPMDMLTSWSILRSYYISGGKNDEIKSVFQAFSQIYDISYLEINVVEDVKKSVRKVIGSDAYNLLFNPYLVLEEEPNSICIDIDRAYRLSLIRCIPADTRPGLNASSLLVHSILTSAIAITLNRAIPSTALDRNEEEFLRLAAIIHDIAKPFAWHDTFSSGRYVSHTDELILNKVKEKLKHLAKLVGNDTLDNIMKCIRYHHAPERIEDPKLRKVVELIRRADSIASEEDRVVVAILSHAEEIAKRTGLDVDTLRVAYSHDHRAWDLWLRLGDDKAREVALAVQELVLSEESVIHAAMDEMNVSDVQGLKVAIIDVEAVQNYIKREDLRTTIGASFFVDIATNYIIPRLAIEHLGIKCENILYSGGGIVQLLIPNTTSVKILEKEWARFAAGYGLKISTAEVNMSIPWRATVVKLFSVLSAEKHIARPSIRDSLSLVDLGIGVPCDICGRNTAVDFIDGRTPVCGTCKKLRDLGEELFIKRYKLQVLKSLGYSIPNDTEKLMKRLMEWLSGAEDWDKGGYLSIAVVKADMNLGGLFMNTSINITSGVIKSMLIDYALKKGVYEGLKKVLESFSKHDQRRALDLVARLFSGILYAGGDDLLAVVPSMCTLQLALAMAITFWSIVGSRQLSIAIASGKPKHNIWNLIDTASRLLDECKDKVRLYVGSLKDLEMVVGVFAISYSFQQLLPSIVHTIEGYRSQGLSVQPFILEVDPKLNVKEGRDSIYTHLKIFTMEKGSRPLLRDAMVQWFSNINELQGYAKEIEKIVKEVYSVVKGKQIKDVVGIPSLALVYMTNYVLKLSEEEIYSELAYRLRDYIKTLIALSAGASSNLVVPLYDLYLVSKVIQGG